MSEREEFRNRRSRSLFIPAMSERERKREREGVIFVCGRYFCGRKHVDEFYWFVTEQLM